jgi:hypothetical protein
MEYRNRSASCVANPAAWVNTIGTTKTVHADFGSGLYHGAPIGIPYIVVPGFQPMYPAHFTYAEEIDPGPCAVPLNAPIEGGSTSSGDRHAIAIDGELHTVRAVRGISADERLAGGVGSDLQSAFERAATFGMDERGRGGSADLPGTGAVRRGGGGCDQPRHPLHGPADAETIPVARAALCVIVDGIAVSADGRAVPAEGGVSTFRASRQPTRLFCRR